MMVTVLVGTTMSVMGLSSGIHTVVTSGLHFSVSSQMMVVVVGFFS